MPERSASCTTRACPLCGSAVPCDANVTHLLVCTANTALAPPRRLLDMNHHDQDMSLLKVLHEVFSESTPHKPPGELLSALQGGTFTRSVNTPEAAVTQFIESVDDVFASSSDVPAVWRKWKMGQEEALIGCALRRRVRGGGGTVRRVGAVWGGKVVGSGDGSYCVRVGVVVEAIRVVQRGGVVVFGIVVPEMAVQVEWRPGGNPKDTYHPLTTNDTIPHTGALYAPQHTTFLLSLPSEATYLSATLLNGRTKGLPILLPLNPAAVQEGTNDTYTIPTKRPLHPKDAVITAVGGGLRVTSTILSSLELSSGRRGGVVRAVRAPMGQASTAFPVGGVGVPVVAVGGTPLEGGGGGGGVSGGAVPQPVAVPLPEPPLLPPPPQHLLPAARCVDSNPADAEASLREALDRTLAENSIATAAQLRGVLAADVPGVG